MRSRTEAPKRRRGFWYGEMSLASNTGGRIEVRLNSGQSPPSHKKDTWIISRVTARLYATGEIPSMQDTRCRRLLKTDREGQQASCQRDVNLGT